MIGFERVPFADYLSREALSASGIKDLLKAPALYRWKRDNPQESTAVFDLGKAAHRLVLGDGDPIEVIDADDWRSKAAREARDEATAAGRTPLLTKEWEQVEQMAATVKANPYARGLLSRKGDAETSLFWTDPDTGVPCKARPDWLVRVDGVLTIVDYKTTRDAEPTAFARSCRTFGYDIQVAWYLEAVRQVMGEEATFQFIAQEKRAPYLTSVVAISPVDIAEAEYVCRDARETYAKCMKTGEWPGYGIHTVTLPPVYNNEIDDSVEEMVVV